MVLEHSDRWSYGKATFRDYDGVEVTPLSLSRHFKKRCLFADDALAHAIRSESAILHYVQKSKGESIHYASWGRQKRTFELFTCLAPERGLRFARLECLVDLG